MNICRKKYITVYIMNSVKNFFGNIPIYWLNLKDSLDRYNNAVNQLKDYPNHLRIEAVDGRDEKFFLENYNVKYKTSIDFSYSLVAVVCSHAKAIKTAYDNNVDKVCIFEDDFSLQLLEYYPHTLDEIINKAPEDWEIIQLYYYNVFKNDFHLDEYKEKGLLVFKPKMCYGGTCYLINKKGMEKILNLVNTDGKYSYEFNLEMTSPERVLYRFVRYYIVNLPPILYVDHLSTMEGYKRGSKKGNYIEQHNLNGKKKLEFLLELNKKSNKKILHFVIIPFMIVSENWLKFFKTDSKKDILNDTKLLPRINNLKRYFTYWIKIQINKNFFAFIIIDDDLDKKYILMLKDAIKELDNVYIIKNNNKSQIDNDFINYESQKLNSEYNDFKKLNEYVGEILYDANQIHMLDKFDYFITSRIDDDNILDKNAIDFIQKCCEDMELDIKMIGFERGYILQDKITNMQYPQRYKDVITTSSIGLSIILKTKNNNIKKSFNIYFAHHGDMVSSLKNISNNNNYFEKSVDHLDKRYYYNDTTTRFWIYNNKISFTGRKRNPYIPLNEKQIEDFKERYLNDPSFFY